MHVVYVSVYMCGVHIVYNGMCECMGVYVICVWYGQHVCSVHE